MGRKTKNATVAASVKPTSEVEPKTLQEVEELKTEGDTWFGKGEYSKSFDAYERALKLLPPASTLKTEIYCNRAACFLRLKRNKDAVRECNNALQVSPNSAKALSRRCKAFEGLGLYKQALADAVSCNKLDATTDEMREAEKRLKVLTSSKKGKNDMNGVAPLNGNAFPAPGLFPFLVPVKCSLGKEVRYVHILPTASYADLLATVHEKFPESGPVNLKFVDRDGDLVLITNKHDVQVAIKTVAPQAGWMNPANARSASQPLRLILTSAASQEEIPQPPADEVSERKAFLSGQSNAQEKSVSNLKDSEPQQQEAFEVDEWLIDFANLFRDMTGIDFDRHLDFHNEGWEKITKAMDSTLQSEKALPLFEKAAEKFQEVACMGLMNWGNVYACIGHKTLEEAASKNVPISDVRDQVMAEFDKAAKRFDEALHYKNDFFDGLLAHGQLEFDRAKVVAGLLVQTIRTPSIDSEANPKEQEQQQTEAAAASNDLLKTALKNVTSEGVDSAEKHIALATKWFHRAMEVAPTSKASEEAQDAEVDKEDGKEDGIEDDKEESAEIKPSENGEHTQKDEAEMEIGPKGQCQIMHGNILYEWSQILAVVERDWRPVLDSAVALFREAGCSEHDIRNALKNHTQQEHLDLGPDAEAEGEPPAGAEVQDAPSDVPEESKANEIKGLPSLDRKHKAKVNASK